ncbi:MAG TPA: hypothetical protein VD790_01890 [Thermoleophilaceae bacterium]|nr:hypothetical protein [Thermoleophilaceae bacterium]
MTATRLGARPDRLDVLGGVNRGDLLEVRLRRLAPLEPQPAAPLELVLDRRDARPVLGMRPGVVLERAPVAEVERRADAGTVIRP